MLTDSQFYVIQDSINGPVIRSYSLPDGAFTDEIALKDKLTPSSLCMISVGQPSKKKRRRSSASNSHKGPVWSGSALAVGTTTGSISILSSGSNELMQEILVPSFNTPVRFLSVNNGTLWASSSNGKVAEIPLVSPLEVKTVYEFKDRQISRVCYMDGRLLATSHTVHVFPLDTEGRPGTKSVLQIEPSSSYPIHTTPVNTLVASKQNRYVLSAADNDRFINAVDIETGKSAVIMVAQADVKMAFCNESESLAGAVTVPGFVEIFEKPFVASSTSKSGRKSSSGTKSSSTIVKVVHRFESGDAPAKPVSVLEASFISGDSDILQVVWLQGGSQYRFERIPVDLSKPELIVVVSENQSVTKIGNGVNGLYSESNAVITSGNNHRDLEDQPMKDLTVQSTDEPTLAEQLEVVEGRGAPKKSQDLQVVAGSLVSVLTQALRSNDKALLETCLSTDDESVIRTSAQGLEPVDAIKLLESIADILAVVPNRAGELTSWIQWTIVVHGGYLSSISSLSSSLASLYSVLTAHAAKLQSLLALQGRLTMLRAQIELRREVGKLNISDKVDEPAAVTYVESDEDISEDEMEEDYDIEEGEDDSE
ncbi:hypothetical protein CANCADRAFT_43540 [Tortispora caseinolytica NRRL Y-17796]|uniref:Small-subunit processome Utp12 domain-containing protein n=1 Tax=Tortispora caseinolytica NRRL Y-17796 TaxID=767744 RepID=A0A1E4TMH4_9ASCO|nr:hypothetical protein CANCADRAFT_43540 [Tortispora caseinolytica NRRL Y-17796]